MFPEKIQTPTVLAPFLVFVLFWTDYLLTLYGSLMNGRQKAIVLRGGCELTDFFASAVARRRLIPSSVILVSIARSLTMLFAEVISEIDPSLNWIRDFTMGYLLLPEAVVHMRHVENIIWWRSLATLNERSGSVELEKWLMLRKSGVNFCVVSFFFAAVASVAEPFFFLGGFFYCATEGVAEIVRSIRDRPK